MDNSKETSQPTNTREQIAYYGTLIQSAVLLLISVASAYLFLTQENALVWVNYVSIGIIVVVAGLNIASIALTLRGRQTTAYRLAFLSIVLFLLGFTLLIQGRVIVMSLLLLLTGTIGILWLCPPQERRQYLIITSVVFAAAWVVEWINPPWRITYSGTQVGLSAAVVFIILIAVMVFVQYRKTIASSLRLQIMVWTGSILAVVSIALTTYSVLTTQQLAVQTAQEEAGFIAEAQAGNVQSQLDPALNAARTMAYTLGVSKDPTNPVTLTRRQANGILRKVLEENPTFLGTWTLWEPNEFDGLDSRYQNTALHDETGRFIPYWVRIDNEIEGVAIVDYETPGLNDYYAIPRETQKETILTPYFYQVGDINLFMTSVVVPIVENGRFYGAAGVDLPINFVQNIVDQVDLFNGSANAVLLTEDGTLIAVRNQPDLALQPAATLIEDFDQIQTRIRSGESFVSTSPDGEFLRAFYPITVGESESRWIFAIVIPFSEITAQATSAAILEGIISLVLMTIALYFLWFLTGQITKPILDLTNVAGEISQGNLNANAQVNATNETGTLAKVFNLMTSQLRDLITSLEERIAARTRNLELAAEVGRTVSQVRSLDVMLTEAAELVRKQFDLYYVQVYLVNPSNTYLILQAGTGAVGKELLERSHRLPLNINSLNGRAAIEKKSVVISNTLKSVSFKPNPLLPETRSEIAVPLIIGEKVVGVLDMQSDQSDALNTETLPAFEALAGQLAIAIQNSNLLSQAQQARVELEAQARGQVRTNWETYMDAVHKPEHTGFVFEQDQVAPLNDPTEAQAVSENALATSIEITGEKLGDLVVELDEHSASARSNELVEAVARQVSQHLESLRLLESAERFRAQAEEASRRMTREGWKEYTERSEQDLAYFYDLKEVRPLNGNGAKLEETTNIPLTVRNEVVGKLAIQGLDHENAEAVELVKTVAERLSSHIESLRQFDQTQSALAQSEKLFEASRQLTEAIDLQQLTAAAAEAVSIPAINRAIMGIFNYDNEGNVDSLDIIANWWNGHGHQATAIGTHYPLEVVRMMPMFVSSTPLFFNDATNDERVDSVTMQLVERLNLHAVAILPLHVGTAQVGVLILEGEKPHTFTQEEIRLFIALSPQIATALENKRQFERTQKQAEREAMLNAINQKIQSATSVESVLQIAARELGHALGAPMTIAQLSMKDKDSAS